MDKWKVADTSRRHSLSLSPFSSLLDVLILVSPSKPNRASLLHLLQTVAAMGSRHAHPFKSPAGFPPRTHSSTNTSRYSRMVITIQIAPSIISRRSRNTRHSSWQVPSSFDSSLRPFLWNALHPTFFESSTNVPFVRHPFTDSCNAASRYPRL